MSKNKLSLAVSVALLYSAIAPDIQAEEKTDCVDDCKAPYSLKIITRGEGKPKATNDTAAGLQINRRVDVSLTKKVQEDTPMLAAANSVDGGTGIFWISQNPTLLEQSLGLKVPATATLLNGTLENPVKISIATNYAAFIDRWEIRIVADGASFNSEPLHVIQGSLSDTLTNIEWNGEFAASDQSLRADDKYSVALRVYDKHGAFDQTEFSTIKFIDSESKSLETGLAVEALSVKSFSEQLEDYNSDYIQQSIPVSGSTVTVRGQDIDDVKTLEINGEKIPLHNSQSFAVDYILPAGDAVFEIKAQKKSGQEINESLKVNVKSSHFFMVGIADLTVGENDVTGSIESLAADEHHYGGDIFVDGRLAFYVKGKVRGKYLLTAQMDTRTEDVSELFNDFHRKDANSIFRRVDPDQYYLVYGDDSTIVDDTNSQGKIYLRVDWDKSHGLWGNFNTAFSGTEYASFNRSLYGAQYRHSSLTTTTQGDTKTEVSAFMSEAQTVFRHNEFAGTGGSLYYLRDQDIVAGSEKLWVEVRRSSSEQVVQRIPLERGRDYDIDEFQGRVILNRPLLNVSSQAGPSIIRDEPQLGDNAYLVVDYEYIPSDFVNGDAATGVRGKRWVNDHLAIGGTWTHEKRDSDDYDVKGLDVTIKKSDKTYLRFETARSEASQTSGSFVSDDGGLTFSPFNSNSDATSGAAIGLEARVSVNDLASIDRPINIAAWAKNRDAGFSAASLDTGVDTLDTGVEVVSEVSDVLSLSGRATRLEKTDQSIESLAALQADYKVSDTMTVSGEVRSVNDEVLPQVDGSVLASKASATLVAGKVSKQFSDTLSVYGIAQGALDRSGNYDSNRILTAGAKAKISQDTSLSGEISQGDRGTDLTLGAEKTVSDTYSVYGNLNLFNDSENELEQSVTVGQRKTFSDNLKFYAEHQFSSISGRVGGTNTIGLSNTFNRYTTATLSFQVSRSKDDFDEVTRRNTLSAGLTYKRNNSHFSNKIEYRQDKSNSLDTDQWVMTNALEYRQSVATRWQGRLNVSTTEDNLTGDDAKFAEIGIGFAHRPVNHDRINLLGRYSFLYDLPPLSQSDKTDRRASIYSFESVYEFSKRWNIGGKLAHRQGEIRSQRASDNWASNDAGLASMRLRFQVPFGVYAMGSYQWLWSDATDSSGHGALLSLGYSVGKNLQFSVGYNFTSFDDNLSNDDYDVSGWFLNLVGKF